MTSEFDRIDLIGRLHAALESLHFVHAAWLEGADAKGRADEYSDLDLWFDVDMDEVERVYNAIRQVLLEYGPLDVEEAILHPHPQIRQRFYRSAGLPPFCFVDACAQEHGREVVFGPQDAFQVLFDRDGVLKRGNPGTAVNIQARAEQLSRRRWRWVLVEKELCRENMLEALAYYHGEVLTPLVELLRLRYCPEKYEFGLKHIYRDLPADIVRRLENLYTRTDVQGIGEGLDLVGQWFEAELKALG